MLKTDYDTTINLLKIYPQFGNGNFWEEKCKINYPDKTYLDKFTEQENYLLKERTFILAVDDNGDARVKINSRLIEYSPANEQKMKIALGNNYHDYLRLIEINITKQFIVLKRNDYGILIYF